MGRSKGNDFVARWLGKYFQHYFRQARSKEGSLRGPIRTVTSNGVAAFCCSLLYISLGGIQALADNAPEMNIPGQFSVSASGSFTYSIPIALPPGTAGMVPNLSLDYSSQNGDGLEGLGFLLNGLPAIKRCPATLTQNGTHGSVNFEGHDRFCLEGQQLVALNGAPYGGNGTEYRTEIDGFSKIESFGSVGGGPAYFKVWTKSGQIMEFGYYSDAQLVPVSVTRDPVVTAISTWAVDKISDTKGNYLRVFYNSLTGDDRVKWGQIYPLEISYTANDAPPPNKLLAYNSVIFKYSARTDFVPQYQAGTVQKISEKLSDIVTCVAVPTTPGSDCPSGSLVFDYKLNYTAYSSNAGTNYFYSCCDRIGSIDKCGGTGAGLRAPVAPRHTPRIARKKVSGHRAQPNAGQVGCVRSTVFNWSPANPIAYAVPLQLPNQTANGQTHNQPDTFNADYNGDGITDATVTLSDSITCPDHPNHPTPFLGTGAVSWTDPNHLGAQFSYFYPPTTSPMTMTLLQQHGNHNCSGTASFYANRTTVMDYDGDGFSDIAQQDQDFDSARYTFIVHNGKDGTFTQFNNAYKWYVAVPWGDFNGDGRSDYMEFPDDDMYHFWPFYSFGNDDSGSADFRESQADAHWANYGDPLFSGDFDGDGCADIFYQDIHNYQEGQIYQYCDSHTILPFLPTIDWLRNSDARIALGDFNGDGKTDVFNYGKDNDGHLVNSYLFLSTGNKLIKVSDQQPIIDPKYNAVVGDFNGDGRADIAFIPNDHSNVLIYISVPTSDGTSINLVQTEIAGIPSGNWRGAVAADWNSDSITDLWFQSDSQDYQFYYDQSTINRDYVPLMVTSVSNGLGPNGGVVTNVTYERINRNGTFYAKGTTAKYPTQDIDGSLFVVKNIRSGNGINKCLALTDLCYSSTYSYAGLVADLRGRGLLGFAQVTVNDDQTGVKQTTNYYTQFPFSGLIASQIKTCIALVCGADTVISKTVNCYKADAYEAGTCATLNPPTAITLADGDIPRYFLALRQTVLTTWDTDGSQFGTTTTNYDYDCDGGHTPCYGLSTSNQVERKHLSDDTAVKTTNTYYAADTTHWFIDRLQQTTVLSTAGSQSIPRTSSFAYDATTGLLTDETVEPNDQGCYYLHSHYGYDTYGNKIQVTVNSLNHACGADRVTNTAYDGSVPNNAAFPTLITNSLSQSEKWSYDPRFGTPILHQGPNEILNYKSTSWSYDSFGRKTIEVRPDGNLTTYIYGYCDTDSSLLPSGESCTGTAVTFAIATPETSTGAQNGPIIVQFYDGLARLVMADTQAFDGHWVRASTDYDVKGRVSHTSRPYCLTVVVGSSCDTGSDNPHLTTNIYTWNSSSSYPVGQEDPEGRVQTVQRPDGSKSVYTYSGLVTTVVVDRDATTTETTTTTKNAHQNITKVVDANGKATTYAYDVFQHLVLITGPAPALIATQYTYDTRYARRKIGTVDPDMGTWSYDYDAYDELISQTDAKGQTATLSYDTLGRLTRRREAGFNANWEYDDVATNGIGKLHYACVRGDNGTGCSSGLASTDYLRTLVYDTLDRPIGVTFKIDGTNYLYSQTYNFDGRTSELTYPSGFKTKNLYVPTYGDLCRIEDDANTNTDCVANSGQIYWTANLRDQEGRLVNQTAGNGLQTTQTFDQNTGRIEQIAAGASGNVANFIYAWDYLGNLQDRQDANESLTEYYCYDLLNRLTNTAQNGTSCTTGTNKKTMVYDISGNITKKSDISVNNGYGYGNGAGPHALTSITNCSGCSVNGVVNPTFAYDLNGNMICEMASGQTNCPSASPKLISWTAFNMVDKIINGGSLPVSGLQFAYDPEHARTKQCIPNCSVNTSVTTYLNAFGGMEEKVVGSNTAWNDYVLVDGKIIAERHNVVGTVPPNTMTYFTLDHLGSVAVITNAFGVVTTGGRLSYDAWGRRRNADGTDDPACSNTSSTTRGFTNQEELDTECLVNLNARIYDPTLGRFMSPDPTVEAIYDLQDLNRYSYVGNNPLSLTDTSGLCFLGCFWNTGIFRSLAAIVVAVTAQEWALPELEGLSAGASLSSGVGVLNAGISGGLSGFVSTGKLNGAMMGALEGVAFAGVHFAKAGLNITDPVGAFSVSAGMHGMVGGMFSMAQGQGFKSGFLAAGFADMAGDDAEQRALDAAEVARHAVAGGVGSVLGGGKFANGAITGAFGYVYNQSLYSMVTSFNDATAMQKGVPASQIVREHTAGNFIAGIVTLPLTALDIAVAGLAGGSGIVLYRGVSSDSPAFLDALEGTASARGTLLDPALHNAGTQLETSGFTSWTTDYATAEFFATNGGRTTGVILQQTVPRSALTLSPDFFQESEVLRAGTTTGASTTLVGPK